MKADPLSCEAIHGQGLRIHFRPPLHGAVEVT